MRSWDRLIHEDKDIDTQGEEQERRERERKRQTGSRIEVGPACSFPKMTLTYTSFCLTDFASCMIARLPSTPVAGGTSGRGERRDVTTCRKRRMREAADVQSIKHRYTQRMAIPLILCVCVCVCQFSRSLPHQLSVPSGTDMKYK